TLDAAGAQLDYYDALGISHLYLSPVARARCGSTHGYDVIDHAQVNPELGGLAALRRLAGRPPGRTLRGRVLLPVLTCGARAALASGEI
ncbi:alpha-amylase family glycosyl hydrolase, partial [Bordetella pertussis]|uniref:alpha-amylase family glycosyl hydrolase n=1 Tax=Bordetella pertussis TaxID=520 RepID=UPI000A88B006